MKKRILGIITLLCMLVNFVPSVTAAYTQRTHSPNGVTPYYYSNENPFYAAGLVGECTWYAWGRAYEILGTKPYLPTSNAGAWYNSTTAYEKNTNYYSAKVGAIACYSGHVAVVEAVGSDGAPSAISEGGFMSSYIAGQTIEPINERSDRWFHYGKDYTKGFQGYIYLNISEPTPTPTPTPKREGLELGDRSDDVKKLQETLNGITGTALNADGYFGTSTEAAVKAYQQKKGLNADGWYGPKTKAALEDEVKKMQETLNGMTGTKLNADGWYGSNTKKAVVAYQQKKGLSADGWYGSKTKAALENEVKTMQNMLNAVTGTSLGADGWFGPNTQKAVKAYQQKKGLTVDGWYGGITKAALEADYNALTSPATSTSVTSPDPTAAPISTPSEVIEPEIPEQPSIGENTPDTVNKDNESSSVLTVYGGDTLQIAVDNKMADFGDAQPFIDTNSRTQVPIRAVSELLNCTVDWDPVTRSATITRANGDTIVIAIGSVEMTVNGSKVTMDTAALIANDRTYIPLRCVAEAFGLTVDWI